MTTQKEVFLLLGEWDDIRENLLETETQLAQLHAHIYKCREETRKIRLSLPTPDYLDRARSRAGKTTDHELARMRDRLLSRKHKVLASVQKMRDKLHGEFTRHSSSPHYTWLFLVIVASALFVYSRYAATPRVS
jgi:hypothetical protein